MNEKLQKALNNNHGLYQAIFNHYNIHLHIEDSVAYTEKQVPPLYSNLVTRSETWRPDDHLKKIDRKYEAENWREWSIKDSFRVLDLAIYGFAKLFDAQWIYLERRNFKPIHSNHCHYQFIEAEKDLLDWRLAWNMDASLGNKIFNAKLLDDPNVHFVARHDREKMVSGCFTNKTDGVLGISNFFSSDSTILQWSGIVSYLLTQFSDHVIVGYEREKLVDEVALLGFETIGNLRVWLKKRSHFRRRVR